MDNNDFNIGYGNINFVDIRYKINSIIDKLCNSTDKEEIKRIIVNQSEIIFTYDNLINNNRDGVQKLFTSKLFLNVLDNVSLILNLSESEIIFINKMVYDYREYVSVNKQEIDYEIYYIMQSILLHINSKKSKLLSSIIGMNNSLILSNLYYSSYKIEKVVHRVNNFIIHYASSIEEIYKIYKALYDNEQKMKDLFCYSMLETNNSTNENEYIMFKMISNVLMIIIKEEAAKDNFDIILNYINTINLFGITNDKLRFSIKDELEYNIKLNPEDIESQKILYVLYQQL